MKRLWEERVGVRSEEKVVKVVAEGSFKEGKVMGEEIEMGYWGVEGRGC